MVDAGVVEQGAGELVSPTRDLLNRTFLSVLTEGNVEEASKLELFVGKRHGLSH